MAQLQYTKENSEVLKNLFRRTFFRGWSKPRWQKQEEVFQSLEIYLTPDCNLSCQYCYLNKFESKLYAEEIRNSDEILKKFRNAINMVSRK